MSARQAPQTHDLARQQDLIHEALRDAFVSPDEVAAAPAAGARAPLRSAGRGSARRGGLAVMELHRDLDGVLGWQMRGGASRAPGLATGARLAGYRSPVTSRRRLAGLQDNIVFSREVAEIGPNQVTTALQALDLKLNRRRGLHRLDAGRWEPLADGSLASARRVLVFVHGTFSEGQMYLDAFARTEAGRSLVAALQAAHPGRAAAEGLDHVLSFEHETLSVSPLLNALDLEAALVRAGLAKTARVDLVCHSRGGVVAAWWLVNTPRPVGCLVAAGSPLGGTSLASPYRLRSLVDHLANSATLMGGVAAKLGAVSGPASVFLMASASLMQILGGMARALAHLPVADGAIALAPGLLGQARVTNNLELQRLHRDVPARRPRRVCVVSSNYEPVRDHAFWNVWQAIKSVPMRVANAATDRLFPGDNDLVVDTATMDWPGGADETISFPAARSVHHCAYFEQEETIAGLRAWLGV